MRDGDHPATIDEAELAGWDGLRMHCRCGTTMIPWQLLRRRHPERRLTAIAARLVCSTCREKPSEVLLYRPVPGRPAATKEL